MGLHLFVVHPVFGHPLLVDAQCGEAVEHARMDVLAAIGDDSHHHFVPASVAPYAALVPCTEVGDVFHHAVERSAKERLVLVVHGHPNKNLRVPVVEALAQGKVVLRKVVRIAGHGRVPHVGEFVRVAPVDKRAELGRDGAVEHQVAVRKWHVPVHIVSPLLPAARRRWAKVLRAGHTRPADQLSRPGRQRGLLHRRIARGDLRHTEAGIGRMLRVKGQRTAVGPWLGCVAVRRLFVHVAHLVAVPAGRRVAKAGEARLVAWWEGVGGRDAVLRGSARIRRGVRGLLGLVRGVLRIVGGILWVVRGVLRIVGGVVRLVCPCGIGVVPVRVRIVRSGAVFGNVGLLWLPVDAQVLC